MNKVVRGRFIRQQLLYFIVGQRCCQRFTCIFRSAELETIVEYARAHGLRIILISGLQECVKVFKQSCKHYLMEPKVLTLCHATIIKMRNVLSDAILLDNDRLQMTEQSICNVYPNQQSLNIDTKTKSLHLSLLERPRSSLFPNQSQLLESIHAHRVTLFQANLSNDKSLLVPTIILKDDANIYCNLKIVCIERENIIATYNSERLAYKLGENIGKTVGLQVSQKSFISSETHVVYTTPTYFLRSLYKKAYNLNHISHIVVSDVYLHEPYTDILLLELKKSIAINQYIKIILLAQNYDSNPIFAFFGEGTEFCLEQTSQLVSRISYFEDIQKYIKLSEMYENPDSFKNISQRSKRYRNAQIDDCLQAYEEIANDVAFRPLLYAITSELVPVNYQHSLTGRTAIFIASQLGNVKHLRLLLCMGADPFVIDNQNENALTIANLKQNVECIDILKNYAVHDYPSKHCKLGIVDYNVLIDILYLLFSNSCFSTGNILIILPSYFHIVKLNYILLTHFLTDNLGNMAIYLLYEHMELEYLNSLLSSCPGKAKIVLTTDIIESLPLEVSFKYLIDTACKRNTTFVAFSCTSEDEFEWLSKDSLWRRQLLLNSDMPMECFRLISKDAFNMLNDTTRPGLQTMHLDKICLYAKMLSPDTLISEYVMNTMFPPPAANVHQTVQFLKKIDVLDQFEKVTWLGRCLIDIPVTCQLGRMLIFGIFLQCLDPILTIVSALTTADPSTTDSLITKDFNLWSEYTIDGLNSTKRKQARISDDQFSDHFTLVRVFQEWQGRFTKDISNLVLTDEYDFVRNCLMEQLANTRSKIVSSLRAANLLHKQEPFDIQTSNYMSDNWPIVKAALTAGMYPNICFVGKDRNGFKSAYSGNMYLHSTTMNHNMLEPFNDSSQQISQWIVCNIEKHNIKYATVVAPLTVALFCGSINLKLGKMANIYDVHVRDNMAIHFFIDEWIAMSSPKWTLAMVMTIRQQFFRIFQHFLIYCGKLGKFKDNSSILKQYRFLLEALNEILNLEETVINIITEQFKGKQPTLNLANSYLHRVNLNFMAHMHNSINLALTTSVFEKHYFLLYTEKCSDQFYQNCDKIYMENVIGKFTRPIASPTRHIYIILYSKKPDLMLSISRAIIQNGDLIFIEYFRNKIPIHEVLNSCAAFKMNIPNFDGRLVSSLIDKRAGKLIMELFAFRHH